MANVNKRRGKYFEDKIAEDYRSILHLDKTQCYRSGSSGARTSIEYNGDISFSDPEKYPIVTECKYYKSMILDHFFPVCQSYIDKWIEQVLEEQSHYYNKFNKEPLTIIIAGKPYDKNYHVLLINYYNLHHSHKSSFIKLYSNVQKSYFILLNYSEIENLITEFLNFTN